MIRIMETRRQIRLSPLGKELASANAATRERVERAAAAANTKRLAEEDASKEQHEVVEALLSIPGTPVTDESIRQVQALNAAYIAELGAFKLAYEIDLEDPARKALMREFELRSLTEFATALYGEEGVARIKTAYGSLREFFEDYTGDQCNAIRPTRPLELGRTPCWICGFPILHGGGAKTTPSPGPKVRVLGPKRLPERKKKAAPGFSNECEHVFPIAQAVFFIDLYRGIHTDPEVIQLVQLEYDWSHRVCNQIKNDTHFVSINSDKRDEAPKWVVSADVVIDAFLKDLYERSDKYFRGTNLLKRAITDYGRWVAERRGVIKARVQAVLDAQASKCYPALFMVAQVAKCLTMFDRVTVGSSRPRKTRRKKHTSTRRRRY